MGIAVNGKMVSYDPSSNDLVDSRVRGNPILQNLEDLEVYSIFRRVKTKRDRLGDGNPLIYALKGTNGYSIDINSITSFLPEFYAILPKVAPFVTSSCVLPVPSSSKVASMFARRVARCLAVPQAPFDVTKKLHRSVCGDLDLLFRSGSVATRDRKKLRAIRHELGRSLSTTFSMKLVESHLRKYFSPFVIRHPDQVPAGSSVLVVDDLVSSGASLRAARDLLKSHGVVDVKFLSLLSSTGRYQRLG